MITIVIPGNPIPKMRHCTTRKGFSFDPQVKDKGAVKWLILQEIRQKFPDIEFPIKGPIHCEFYFYMPIPESFTKTQKTLISWQAFEHITKPDCDNLEKFYLDCMSGIVYEDDKRIYRLSTLKRYDEIPRTAIRIMVPEQSVLKKAREILALFPSGELMDFAMDLEVIADCLDEEFLTHKEEAKENLQLEAAYSLSIFADRYGAVLHQITKKYPGAWKTISEFQEKTYKKDLHHGINGTCYAPQRTIQEDAE